MDARVTPVWTKQFSVGNKELDNQHKQLLGLCKRAVECLGSDGITMMTEAHGILNDLADYVSLHFRAEEKLMQACSYAHYAKHKEEHALYEMKLESLLAEAAAGTLDVAELIHYLSEWWVDHILVSDQAYATAIAESGG